MTYNGLSGGFRLLGDSLNGGLMWRGGFRSGWFCDDFGARVHLGTHKNKGLRGSRSAERADGFKQLFPSYIDTQDSFSYSRNFTAHA